ATKRSRVDLPQPLGPKTAANSPGAISKLTRSNTGSGCPFAHAIEVMGYVPDRQLGSPGALSFHTPLYMPSAGSYHRTRPLCHASSLSRRRKSKVMSPEQTSAIISSAAYMLA